MNKLLITLPEWNDYKLIDSGNHEKYERFGSYTCIRPEQKAFWKKSRPESEWQNTDAVYRRMYTKGGRDIGRADGTWKFNKKIPHNWSVQWKDLTMRLQPKSFKHVGVFPENMVHWGWIQDKIKLAKRPISVLNLFAYTGGCTLAGLAAGASVTHLDSSKEVVTWAHKNAQLSRLDTKPVRWIVDDAVTFVKREVKRGKKYDGIIIDAPKFGRSSEGKVWKFEQDFPLLMNLCGNVLSEKPLFVLINTYTVEYSSISLLNVLRQSVGKAGNYECGEIVIPQTDSTILLPTSLFARWSTL